MTELDELRYPIGRFTPPPGNTAEIRAAHIDTLDELPGLLSTAVSGLSDAQLDTPYRQGGWTVRQVVHHVADSHAHSYLRFKLALTENWPTIKPYDEAATASLADSKLPLGASLEFIRALHFRWVALLGTMSDEDFQKGFNHPECGGADLGTTLAIYAWHSRHHTAHITGLRARQGW